MSLPFLNTAPGYDEELRNSVFFERGLHATSICGAVGAAVARALLGGGPGNPLSDEELARKFHDNAGEVPPGGARGRARGPNARPS